MRLDFGWDDDEKLYGLIVNDAADSARDGRSWLTRSMLKASLCKNAYRSPSFCGSDTLNC
jgi:hypothetical protein